MLNPPPSIGARSGLARGDGAGDADQVGVAGFPAERGERLARELVLVDGGSFVGSATGSIRTVGVQIEERSSSPRRSGTSATPPIVTEPSPPHRTIGGPITSTLDRTVARVREHHDDPGVAVARVDDDLERARHALRIVAHHRGRVGLQSGEALGERLRSGGTPGDDGDDQEHDRGRAPRRATGVVSAGTAAGPGRCASRRRTPSAAPNRSMHWRVRLAARLAQVLHQVGADRLAFRAGNVAQAPQHLVDVAGQAGDGVIAHARPSSRFIDAASSCHRSAPWCSWSVPAAVSA